MSLLYPSSLSCQEQSGQVLSRTLFSSLPPTVISDKENTQAHQPALHGIYILLQISAYSDGLQPLHQFPYPNQNRSTSRNSLISVVLPYKLHWTGTILLISFILKFKKRPGFRNSGLLMLLFTP